MLLKNPLDEWSRINGILNPMKKSPVTKEEVKEIVQSEIRESEKRLSDKLDSMTGEFKSMKDEFTLQMGKYEQINEIENSIENHEERLKKLEHPAL